MAKKYDFSGWATKVNLKCSDGRTIRKDAFKENDGATVPLVWNHQHNDANNVLGHAVLENREEGVYAYGTFNDTEQGKNAKLLVSHGDLTSLSIWANNLQEAGGDVLHGKIREVSLVLAGANPGAFIDAVIAHGAEVVGEAIIYNDEEALLMHSDEDEQIDPDPALEHKDATTSEPAKESKSESDENVADVFETLTDKQKTAVYAIVGCALEDDGENDGKDDGEDDTASHNETDNSKGGESMKHNVFDQTQNKERVLSHSEMVDILAEARRNGSLRDTFIAHGITDIGFLFPDAANVTNQPGFIQRDMGWVDVVMKGVHRTPFSRIKSMFANITEDDARAKGYIKGNLKKEEVFSLLKRTTTPTTIYKKQKIDRDDMVDITDFDVVSWLKAEMRMMLDEEIARSVLVGDGRLNSSDDKINETNIRPISLDESLYTVQTVVSVAAAATDNDKANAFITACIKSRKAYKGSGSPSLFTTEDQITACLLLKDKNDRFMYSSVEELAKVLRVKEIIAVPAMEGAKGKAGGTLLGIIVNLTDYNIGADKGGAVNMFDDFDIDYNAQKYLIETRCSGALIKPYSAIALELAVAVG